MTRENFMGSSIYQSLLDILWEKVLMTYIQLTVHLQSNHWGSLEITFIFSLSIHFIIGSLLSGRISFRHLAYKKNQINYFLIHKSNFELFSLLIWIHESATWTQYSATRGRQATPRSWMRQEPCSWRQSLRPCCLLDWWLRT